MWLCVRLGSVHLWARVRLVVLGPDFAWTARGSSASLRMVAQCVAVSVSAECAALFAFGAIGTSAPLASAFWALCVHRLTRHSRGSLRVVSAFGAISGTSAGLAD
jgi:hypothetical protein